MPSTPMQHINKATAAMMSTPKRRQQALISYRKKFGECMIEYIDTDTHLLQIMKSIVHLRERIVSSNSYVEKLQEEQQEKKQQRQRNQQSSSSLSSTEWKQYGFRGGNGGGTDSSSSSNINGCHCCYLTLKDVQDALSYDILQHEKMLRGCRTTLASLSTLLDTTSRRLDEWFEYDLQLQEIMQQQEEEVGEDDKYSSTLNVSNALQIYQYLASDLYHKQQLVQVVLDTSGDDTLLGMRDSSSRDAGDDGIMIGSNDDDDDYYDDDNNDEGLNDGTTTTNPRRAAKKCVKRWNALFQERHDVYERQWEKLVQDFVTFATNGSG